MKNIIRNIIEIVNACYLCIRFPFLYPRNRFTGKHYNNWTLLEKENKIKDKWFKYSKEHQIEYCEKFGVQSLFALDDKSYNNCMVKAEYVMKLAPFYDRFMYKFYQLLNDFLGIFHIIPTYTELDAMPRGWRKRLGIDLCKELKTAILKTGGLKLLYDFRIVDIKEKGGTLQVYVGCGNDEIYRVINKYEYLSQYVCINCGEDADKVLVGYYDIPYCDKCLPEGGWRWIETIYDWNYPDRIEENKRMWGDDE